MATKHDKETIVVFGATGQQGGSVARALSTVYHVRAVTRNPSSDSAKRLQKYVVEIGKGKGKKRKVCDIEIVKGDLDKPETLKSCLAGAYGCFILTDYWDHCDLEIEAIQGIAAVDACIQADVKHVVYSGLESCKELLGKVVPHFDGKYRVVKYIQECKDLDKYTIIKMPFYYENLLSATPPVKGKNKNTYLLPIPMADVPLNMMSVNDLGACVRTIFHNPNVYCGKSLGLAADRLAVSDIARVLSKHLAPRRFVDANMTCEEYEKQGFEGADALADMFHLYQQDRLVRDIELTTELNPDLVKFEDWVVQHMSDIIDSIE